MIAVTMTVAMWCIPFNSLFSRVATKMMVSFVWDPCPQVVDVGIIRTKSNLEHRCPRHQCCDRRDAVHQRKFGHFAWSTGGGDLERHSCCMSVSQCLVLTNFISSSVSFFQHSAHYVDRGRSGIGIAFVRVAP